MRRKLHLLLLPLLCCSCANLYKLGTEIEEPPQRPIVATLEKVAPKLDQEEIEEIAVILRGLRDEHGLEPNIVLGVMHVESTFNPRAKGPVGSLGIMQLHPRTARLQARALGIPWKGARALYDPVYNVRLGTAYLLNLLAEFPHLPHALAAYNAGPGRVQQLLRRGTGPRGTYYCKVSRAGKRLAQMIAQTE